MDEENKIIKKIKVQSTIAFILGLLILGLLIGGIIFLKEFFSPSKELISTTESIDGKYKVEAYLINGGATVDWAVRCYLKSDKILGKKLIYNDYHIDSASLIWIDNDTISINGHKIDLPDGKYDFRDE
ncbi:MAG: DUF5412 family protein [Clostridium celatum]|uniref:DUF5412 family protein n=1 Tax=uncultured Clostridium sp. TaxID=59620 RepID=UPI0025DB6077|nr:DUF5412 family protein [uncultured Clostridium sp.]MDU4884405.1 DUF5412 family protein [Clostridium celatum]MDU5261221.1 DUF5412 family protein [Clostridium celatum]MDU7077603.1 DUF5412 family protein [Clostridium celatum]